MANVDVAIIGGGLMGWSTAYRLTRAGVSVTVVDRADNGYATAAGAGIIAPGTSFRDLPAFYPFAIKAVAFYPAIHAELAEDGETETGYETCGALFVARDEEEAKEIPATLRIMTERRDAGMGNIGKLSLLDAREARELLPPLAEVPAAIHLAAAARVNGRSLRDALRSAAVKRGATAIAGDAVPTVFGNRATGVQVGEERIPAGAVVIAGGSWSHELGALLGISIPTEPQRGQIIHLDVPGGDTGGWPIVQGHFEHYLLAFRPNRVVMGATREAGSGFDYRLTAGGVSQVLNLGLALAPGLATATVAEIRIGMRPMSPDGLPLLGKSPKWENVYLCTGHGPSGLQLGPYSGAVVAGEITGQRLDLDLTPFDPGRFS
jgi:D-amino-acid dehydrogenase